MPLSFQRFLQVCNARFVADAEALPALFAPSTDSRTLTRGEVFVCLRGPHYDGHDFIAAAIGAGTSAIVVDDASKGPRQSAVPIVRVDDAKAAYLAAASAARQEFSGRLIGITGSNGKTTTKEMTAQLLAADKRVVTTPNNENNELGVAKLCFRLNDDVDVAVAELGARHPNEIAALVDIALPDVGVLTNVGEAHMEFFREEEDLARTKFAIFGRGAHAVCNAADAWSRSLAAESKIDTTALWIRLCGDPRVPGLALEAGSPQDGQVAISLGASHSFASWRLPGDHNLRNALMACGAALQSGVPFESLCARLGELRLPPGRFESHRTSAGATIVYDAYNASPTAALHALRAFLALPASRHIAVLGSMAELGPQAARHHQSVGKAAAEGGVDLLYCSGEHADALVDGAAQGGMPRDTVIAYGSNAEVTQLLRAQLRSGDCVLLKGSRIQHMEQILEGLAEPSAVAS
ncbi:MAG: hypothetical protein DLM53_02840 [Candidatus Eremiobacter antarcticus]|nr:UDP-N-acetylmuramoyl-tripeptide--D-alanyl-D-alanine ligase [Candidatus Eremiobacteraeota bacterium]MBC5808348.1 UDP-N-acetylmuramoyl-tripeptide--D-alanyl-D-alanine ligase [Candidatus Eremiobacteraeota bacterium]PZR63716.1 MAG: hypothetical protein DLM53_02840 [Candidatus Eremiobacter sp. RRmetagenome_bin22]